MRQENHVIVVGGGAAGLAAAAAVEQAGLSCQLLEAQACLGGRIRTVPLRSGGVFDEGAQMVNGDMHAVLDLAARAGLHLSPVPRAGIGLCLAQGSTRRFEDLISVGELHELLEEQVLRWDSPGEALRALRLKLAWWNTPWESLGEAGRGLRLLVAKRTAPKESLAEALRGLLLEAEEHAMAYSHFSEVLGAAPEDIHAQAVRDIFARYASERDDLEFQIAGGMIGIVDQLALELRHRPRLSTPVERIRATGDRVEVVAAAETWTADHVIVAVPPPAARRITFEVDSGDELAALLASFTAGAMIKTVLVFDRAFWRLKGLSGAALFADTPGLAVVDGSGDGPFPSRLTAFLGGPLARQWAALSQEARQDLLLGRLSHAFGEGVRAPLETAEAVWIDHPWSGGGYNATVRVGGNPDAVARLAAWGGRVRFAGAEVDDRFWGYVEGAIHSGRSVAAQITGNAAGDVICETAEPQGAFGGSRPKAERGVVSER
ncbi:NAD(P)/FAD-dependent oxidoreductase [Pelagibius sp.]|uniref:flavin monoamine oxidase family protein n=1 Tax=Pelagibius sp. TaxID=1931238 RepID=UPI0026349472|nr:NAD(P)/FAD-dependent oxidoreductase [Pelagibius sp.]